jgi:hypothetical protein
MKSLQIKLNSQTSNDDNRGGEKKVMKKSLSVLVATAMVSSIFASVAFAADLTTQQKLDELIKLGIFDKDGTGNGSELNANMSREQLAKILAKLKELKEVSGTSYTDVAADRWSAGFIQAVSKATPPLMDGVATGLFDPAGNVTLEQLATVAVRALGLQQNTTATVKGNVSDWAKGYVAAAIANGLLSEKADYTKPAIRSELVEASYSAQQAIVNSQKPAKASVKSAKATGVSKIEVALDRDVDDKVAKLSVKKGSVDIAIASTTWSTDKKTATLTLKDAKISEGEYTVTLGGLAAADIGTATATFQAENEKITKLEFSTASDTIAQSTKARVQFRAVNQYNEPTGMTAGNFTVTTPNFNSSVTKDNTGNFVVTIDTQNPISGSAIIGSTVIPIYIYENDSRISVQQNFKLGSQPFVTKMELGDVKYPSGKKSLTASGEYATIPVTVFDQYGNPMAYDSQSSWVANIFTTPYSTSITPPTFGDFDSDNFGEVKVALGGRVEKTEDYTVTVQIGGANQSTKVSVSSVKLVTKIQFGAPSDSLNVLDQRDVYIPITGYDAEGNVLTADELVEKENYDKINVSATNVLGTGAGQSVVIEKSGQYKGQLHITGVAPGASAGAYAFFSAYLTSTTGNNSYITLNVPISKARIPDKVSVVTANAPKTVGGASTFKVVVLDQNGKELDNLPTVTENGQTVTYDVYVEYIGTNGTGTTPKNDLKIVELNRLGSVVSGSTVLPNATPTIYTSDLTHFNNRHQFQANASTTGTGEKLEYKASLRKIVNGGTPTVISTASRSIAYVNGANENLTYTVGKPTAMFATKDSILLTSGQSATGSIMGRNITITAKDSAGDTVVLLNSGITNVTSSVYSVAQTDTNGTGTGRVIGYTPGTATLTVAYTTLKGEVRTAYVDVEVKGDAPVITSLASDATAKVSSADGYTRVDQFMNLTMKDQYGVSYGTTNIAAYSKITGAIYTVDFADPADVGKFEIAANGTITDTLASGVHYFTITANAGGKSTSTYVKYTK